MPDPTSIELMHRFVRAAFLSQLDASAASGTSRAACETHELEGGMPGALDIYLSAVASQAPEVEALREAILGFSPHLVINSARSK